MKETVSQTTAVCLIAFFSCAFAAAQESKRASGQGGFPLTDSVTSMWGAVDEIVSEARPKPLTFMIYFSGKPGWHRGKWSFSAGMDQQPAFIEFAGPVVLRAEYNRNTQMLRVFGEEFDISKSNVLLVQQVDDPEHRKPVALGRIDLNIPPAANPATYVLDTHKNIRDVVMPIEQ